jgi:hypothetical protein
MFYLIDTHTHKIIGQYQSRNRANITRDKKDNEYGSYRYRVSHEDFVSDDLKRVWSRVAAKA